MKYEFMLRPFAVVISCTPNISKRIKSHANVPYSQWLNMFQVLLNLPNSRRYIIRLWLINNNSGLGDLDYGACGAGSLVRGALS